MILQHIRIIVEDSNPGLLTQQSSALPMSHHIFKANTVLNNSSYVPRCSQLETENAGLQEQLRLVAVTPAGFTTKDNVQHTNELLYLKVSPG